MKNKILVVTPTLGNRDSLTKTIRSVALIGENKVKHVIIAPQDKIPHIKECYKNITCIPEPEGKKGIYAALNFGFNKYAKEYKYMTFINDDDFWLPDFSVLIDTILNNDYGLVYGKTKYVDSSGVTISEQSCSSDFKNFIPLLRGGIVLLTQQATIIRSDLFFKIGGFDESYKLVADTKFWALLSLENINTKFINKCCAGYTIQEGQLSSDGITQGIENKRMLSELPSTSSLKSYFSVLFFRLSNLKTYAKRLFKKRITSCI